MKDPKRIKRILKIIENIWTSCPELRLTQLIMNCLNINIDYYIEDDILEKSLKNYSNNLLAHEIWAASQLLPGESIENGVERIVKILQENGE